MKSFCITTLLLALFSVYASPDEGMIDFNDAPAVYVNPEVARISPDGHALEINLKSKKFAPVFIIKAGMLKCNTNYLISFRYRIDSPMTEDIFMAIVKEPKDPFFHFGIRSRHDSKVVNPLRFRALSRQMTNRTERVFVPDTADDFIFHCDAYGTGTRGVIEDLRIQPAIADKFIPLFQSGKAGTGPLKLPTGAKEFEVAKPNNPNGEVVDAEKFGVSPGSSDNTAAIRKALDYCRKENAAKLVLPKGTLRFGSPDGPDGSVMNSAVSNSTASARVQRSRSSNAISYNRSIWRDSEPTRWQISSSSRCISARSASFVLRSSIRIRLNPLIEPNGTRISGSIRAMIRS